MSVTQVQAWQTSDGQCFMDKADAYHEEMVALLKAVPGVGKKGFSLPAFTDALGGYQALLAKLQALRAALDGESDRRILAGLDKLIGAAAGWLDKAESLRRQMSGETDQDTAAKVRGQE